MRKIKCPNCGTQLVYSRENKSRPFCSDRCKLIDLGEWANESYKISEKSSQPPENALVDFDDSIDETITPQNPTHTSS